MKKVISLVLALVLVCGLAVNALAAGFDVSVDANVFEAGETVIATVTLDEAVEKAAQLQIELLYDAEALTYVSNELAAGYDFLTAVADEGIITFSYLDFQFKGTDLAAGTVATVTFTVNETTYAADLELTVDAAYGDTSGNMNDLDPVSAEITVCPGHSYIETKSEATCQEPATVIYQCEYCGDSYPGESEGVYGDHVLSPVEATYTCTEDGQKEHFVCDVCGKCFEITETWEPGEELTEEELYAPAGHMETQWPSEEYNDDGSITREYYCVLCNEVLRTEIAYPGDEANPIYLYPNECPVTTVEVPAGGSVYYMLNMFGGNYVVISGDNFTVNAAVSSWGSFGSEVTYTSVDGVVKFIDTATRWGSTRIEIVNNGSTAATYSINVETPLGAMENPETLYIGENTATTYEGVAGYYMQWIADCNGTFTVTLTEPGEYWSFYIYNTTTSEMTDEHAYDTDGVMTDSVAFSVGDTIQVYVMNSAWSEETYQWSYPAGDITFEAGVEYVHNVEHVAAVAPSCSEEGNIEYWYCVDCGAAWADEACTQVTNLMSVKLAPWCQNVVHMEAVEPGCHYTGNVEHWYCVDCDTVWTDEGRVHISNHKSVILPELGGDVEHVEAVAATCTENGNIEYWYCEECEQVWQDEARTQLTNRMNVIVPAGHNIVHIEAVDPGCHYEGNIEHWYCTGECGTVWTNEELTEISNHLSVILPELGGEVVHVEAKEASCFEEGNIEHWYCEECQQVWQDEARTQLTNHKNVILPVVHDIVHIEAVEPGCHYEGNVEYWYCADECGTVWTDENLKQISNHLSVILPELGGEVKHVEAAEADCRNPGHIEYWYCEECEQVWQDEARTQLTNRKNVITEAALGFVDEDKDGVCDICGSSNPHTGDVSIIVAAAAAVISATGIVALPIAKKKFF